MSAFRKELESLINRHSQENGSNTPDFILASFLNAVLVLFDNAVNARDRWHDKPPRFGYGRRANSTHCGTEIDDSIGDPAPQEIEDGSAPPIPAEKPILAGLVRDNPGTPEGKYLVKRRDGSVVEWPSFVLGARDPAAPAALLAYAITARQLGMSTGYCNAVSKLSEEFDDYRLERGAADPDQGDALEWLEKLSSDINSRIEEIKDDMRSKGQDWG